MYAAERPSEGQGNHQSPTQPPRPYERRESISQGALPYQHALPTSPSANRLPPPPSPRDRPVSGYYDPTSESRASMSAPAPFQARSPTQVCIIT